jgi:hypothetical protein
MIYIINKNKTRVIFVGVPGGNVWLQMACTIYKINNIILK